ncbi:MAG: M20/M25/M40 family metallo-hydrolase [Bacteroidales bacterium]|nr:M20/M25/M40 family metallo-hydrolase [Bacteroidales bacterium]
MIDLLQKLISIPGISRQETARADMLYDYMVGQGMTPQRLHNNLWVRGEAWLPGRPTVMLNSHIDTVKPSAAYTRDPHAADIEDGRLYGLGSNDAGASAMALLGAFEQLRHEDLGYNLLLALTAEEEVMGEHGMRAFLPHIKEQGIDIDMAIVGEPTDMQAAIGERGLVVLDCVAHGIQGHAARNEGDNAIYRAVRDIERLQNFHFPQCSALLGPIKITVTQIEAGWQHNVVPPECKFVVDVRTTDAYTNEEVVAMIQSALESDVKERSTRIRASAIRHCHPLVQAAIATGASTFISPTTSDMALMPFPSLKMGPGQSARSHQADEYVLLSEFEAAIPRYAALLRGIK